MSSHILKGMKFAVNYYGAEMCPHTTDTERQCLTFGSVSGSSLSSSNLGFTMS